MYKKILVALENSRADQSLVPHVQQLALLTHAHLLLLHVADGWAARNFNKLTLSESEEMKNDLAYLDRISAEMERGGVDAEGVLAGGDPAIEICAAAERESCDLIAMATHGHGFVQDVIRGSVANEVRHRTRIPVLLVRGDEARK